MSRRDETPGIQELLDGQSMGSSDAVFLAKALLMLRSPQVLDRVLGRRVAP